MLTTNKNFNHYYYHLSTLLIGMLGALIILVVFHMIEKPTAKIGKVNITAMVDNFVKQESKKNIDSDVLKLEIKKYGTMLDTELKRFSKDKDVILLPSEAIIAGAEDYTSAISQIMQEKA